MYPMAAYALRADEEKIYAKDIDMNVHGPMVEDCCKSPPIVRERKGLGLT